MAILQAAVRAAYQQEESKRKGGGGLRQRLSLQAMAFGTNATVRLLPRLDHEDETPWVAVYSINLPFSGVTNAGENSTDEDVLVKVPGMKTWERPDHIINATKYAWNGSDAEKNAIARPYWHRATFYYGVLPVRLPFVEQSPPDNPVRILPVSKQLQDQIVSTGVNNTSVEYAMWCADHGRDLIIRKTQQGQWANYATSTFDFNERPLTEAERAALEKYGLPDMEKDVIGEPPTAEQYATIKEMFLTSLQGGAFDAARWPEYTSYPASYSVAGGAKGKSRSRASSQTSQDVLEAIHSRVSSVVGK